MRTLIMLALGVGGGLLLIPMIVAARGSQDDKSVQGEAARKFRVYLDDDWKRWMTDYPEMATEAGFPGQNRRWTDDSPEGFERRKKLLKESLEAIQKMSRDSLPAEEKMNYDLYRELLETAEEASC